MLKRVLERAGVQDLLHRSHLGKSMRLRGPRLERVASPAEPSRGGLLLGPADCCLGLVKDVQCLLRKTLPSEHRKTRAKEGNGGLIEPLEDLFCIGNFFHEARELTEQLEQLRVLGGGEFTDGVRQLEGAHLLLTKSASLVNVLNPS